MASDDDVESQLLAAVLADPDSDAPRQVYADWLQERGDPRGELIALQLAPRRTGTHQHRIGLLVADKANVARWLGPLAAIVTRPVFERGFLADCTVELGADGRLDELLVHPLWSTVTRVRCTDPRLVRSPAMRSLRTVAGLGIEAIAMLSRGDQPLAIEVLEDVSLGLANPREDELRACWDELGRVGAFTALRELAIVVARHTVDVLGVEPAVWRWLVGSALGRRLARLQIDFGNHCPRVVDWIAAFPASHAGTIAVRAGVVVTACIRRDGDRFRVSLELAKPGLRDGTVNEPVLRLFERFPLPQAPELTVKVTTGATRQQLASLRYHLGGLLGPRFERITVEP